MTMYRRLLLTFIAIVFISLPNLVHAQRSIGKVEPETKEGENVLDIPVKQWTGKRFIFLDKPKSLQKFGYHLYLRPKMYLYHGRYNPKLEMKATYHLRHDEFVGKIIKVVNIQEKYPHYVVTFVEAESNMKIYAETYKGYIDDIAFFDDIAKAKERWLGKTIYSQNRSILTYSEELDEYGKVKVKVGEPLKVIDIWWGFDSTEPLWIIVETTQGERGFISTAFSYTNIYTDRWTETRPWEDDFFEFNPREKYRWNNGIWELINSGKVRVGMNKEQVKLSWGKPEKINKDIYQGSIHEQWIYGSQYLYFENDKLTAIQSH